MRDLLDRARRRLAGYSEAARELADRGALRPDLRPEEAGALIWTLGNPDVYRFLVTEQGWPPERYGTWIEGQLLMGLLGAQGRQSRLKRPKRPSAR